MLLAALSSDPRGLHQGGSDPRTSTSDRYDTQLTSAPHTSALMPAPMTRIDPQHRTHKHPTTPPCLTRCTYTYSQCPYEEDSSLRHLTSSPHPHQSEPHQLTPIPQSPYTPPDQTAHIPPYPTHTHTLTHSCTPKPPHTLSCTPCPPKRHVRLAPAPLTRPSHMAPPPTPYILIYLAQLQVQLVTDTMTLPSHPLPHTTHTRKHRNRMAHTENGNGPYNTRSRPTTPPPTDSHLHYPDLNHPQKTPRTHSHTLNPRTSSHETQSPQSTLTTRSRLSHTPPAQEPSILSPTIIIMSMSNVPNCIPR